MIKIIFYKANNGTVLDKLIAFFSSYKGIRRYSHCEVYFDKLKVSFYTDIVNNECTFRGLTYVNPKHLDIVEIKDCDSKLAYEYCKSIDGSEYDYKGLFFNFILPIHIQNIKKLFCSEVCVNVLKAGKYNKVKNVISHKVSPNKLYYILTKDNICIK